MTSPRREILTPDQSNFFHCISRCVRRAYLCGQSSEADYEHRKDWVRARLFFLQEIFSIEIAAYAVMSNHLHTLLKTEPERVANWSDEEVATRWLKLYPRKGEKRDDIDPNKLAIEEITESPEKLAKYRKRLACISWFQKSLNENIARRANREDNCKGRFWEGRFRCMRIDDLGGVLACGVYIDLNPVRAGISKTPESSDYTSVNDRIVHKMVGDEPLSDQEHDSCLRSRVLLPVEEITNGQMNVDQYLSLVDSTGRMIIDGKGSIPDTLLPILERLQLNTSQWSNTIPNLCRSFKRIIGTKASLQQAAVLAKKKWMHGSQAANRVFV